MAQKAAGSCSHTARAAVSAAVDRCSHAVQLGRVGVLCFPFCSPLVYRLGGNAGAEVGCAVFVATGAGAGAGPLELSLIGRADVCAPVAGAIMYAISFGGGSFRENCITRGRSLRDDAADGWDCWGG